MGSGSSWSPRQPLGVATDAKIKRMRYQVVRLVDGRVLAGSTDKSRAESTAEVLGPGYVVRERQGRS